MSFLNADPFKEKLENRIEGERIPGVQVNQAVYLQHDVFFGNSVVLYTDPSDKQGSLLVKDVDYGFDSQDTIATEQSNSLCYKQLVFYKVFARVYVDYWVYGDIITADTINQVIGDGLAALQKAIQNAQAIAAHLAQLDAHGATQDAAVNTIALRNSRGTFSLGQPLLASEPARKQDLDSETAARQNADAAELAAREAQDLELADRISALSGAVAYLQAHDFGNADTYPVDTDTTIDPPSYNWQDTLSNYAAAEYGEWQTTDPDSGDVIITVPNSVAVKNLWDNHVWIYNTETGLWTDNGQSNVSAFTNQLAGIIKGDEDTFGSIKANPDGTGSVNGLVRNGDGTKVLKNNGTYGELSSSGITNAEHATGRNYNGKPTYIKRWSGYVVSPALVNAYVDLVSGVEGIISYGGKWLRGNSNVPIAIGSSNFNGNTTLITIESTSILFIDVNNNNTVRFKSISSSERVGTTNNAYDIWMEYTKI